jgi:hypothetical protein
MERDPGMVDGLRAARLMPARRLSGRITAIDLDRVHDVAERLLQAVRSRPWSLPEERPPGDLAPGGPVDLRLAAAARRRTSLGGRVRRGRCRAPLPAD